MSLKIIHLKLEQLECLHSENTQPPHDNPYYRFISDPKWKQDKSKLQIKKNCQKFKFWNFAKTLHVTYLLKLLKLLDEMCKYATDPASIVEDTERTLFCPQADGQGETSIPNYCHTSQGPMSSAWPTETGKRFSKRSMNIEPAALTTWVLVDIPSLHGRACAPHNDTRCQVDSAVNETRQDGQRSWKYHRNQLANQQKLKWRYPKFNAHWTMPLSVRGSLIRTEEPHSFRDISAPNIWNLVLFFRNLNGLKFYHHINGLVQERCNSIVNALELHFSCTNPS